MIHSPIRAAFTSFAALAGFALVFGSQRVALRFLQAFATVAVVSAQVSASASGPAKAPTSKSDSGSAESQRAVEALADRLRGELVPRTGMEELIATRGVDFTIAVVDENGKPVRYADVTLASTSGRSTDGLETDEEGKLTGRVWPGAVKVTATGTGRPAVQAAFPDGFPAGKATIVLPKGKPYGIRVVDEAGNPVPGAELTVRAADYSYSVALRSGDDGWATISHAPRGDGFKVEIASNGHLPRTLGLSLEGDKLPLPVVLKSAPPLLLRVVEKGTGTPLPGIAVTFNEAEPSNGFVKPPWTEAALRTNDKGEATLGGLEPGRTYSLKLRGERFAGKVDLVLTPAMTTVAEISPRLPLTLVITNLPPQKENTLVVRIEVDSDIRTVRLPVADGRVEAEIPNGYVKDDDVQLRFAGVSHTESSLTPEKARIVLNYLPLRQEAATREKDASSRTSPSGESKDLVPVTYHIKTKGGEAPPEGTLTLLWFRKSEAGGRLSGYGQYSSAELKNGVAVFHLPAGAMAQLYDNDTRLIGAKLDASHGSDSNHYFPVQEPVEKYLVANPTGNLRVRVVEADGTPVQGAHVIAQGRPMAKKPPTGSGGGEQQQEDEDDDGTGVESLKESIGSHLSDGIAVDTRIIRVLAGKGLRFAMVETSLDITRTNRLQEITVKLPPARKGVIRVVDEAGKPLAGIGVSFTVRAGNVHVDMNSLVDQHTNLNGEIPVELSADPKASAAVHVTAIAQSHLHVTNVTELGFDDKGVALIRLTKGRRFFGRIINYTGPQDLENYVGITVMPLAADTDHEDGMDTFGGSVQISDTGRFEINNAPPKSRLLVQAGGREVRFIEGNAEGTPEDKEIVIELVDKKASRSTDSDEPNLNKLRAR
ncbi:hypothetical protein DB346_17625 [Verrucomicrobia bacterium LW23]|nr:hypothetical protein DB346_17625 [Verrucomicrobia bacterium LW23]